MRGANIKFIVYSKIWCTCCKKLASHLLLKLEKHIRDIKRSVGKTERCLTTFEYFKVWLSSELVTLPDHSSSGKYTTKKGNSIAPFDQGMACVVLCPDDKYFLFYWYILTIDILLKRGHIQSREAKNIDIFLSEQKGCDNTLEFLYTYSWIPRGLDTYRH